MCAKCNDIIEEEPITCADCSNVIEENEEQYTNSNDEIICESCRDDYSTCENCGSLEASDDCTFIEREEVIVCSSCCDNNYFTCDCCNRLTSDSDQTTTCNGNNICQSCYEDHYFTCENCNEILHMDCYNQDGQCEDCYQEDEDIDGLHNYSYKPTPIFQSTIKHKRSKTIKGVNVESYRNDQKLNYLGIELEHSIGNSSKSDIIEDVYSKMHNVYYKEDGSLDDGIELVTHPIEFNSINWQAWNDTLSYLRSKNCKSYNTSYSCGLHIHVSKNAFGNYGLLKAHLLCAKIEKFLHKISKRTSSNWRNWTAPSNINYSDANSFRREIISRRLRKQEQISQAPRGAFNYTGNTIELRMFRGTLDLEGFRSCVEFAKDISFIISQVSLTYLLTHSEAEIESYVLNNLRAKTKDLLAKTNRIDKQLGLFQGKTTGNDDKDIVPDAELSF